MQWSVFYCSCKEWGYWPASLSLSGATASEGGSASGSTSPASVVMATHTHTQSTCSSLSLTGIHVQHNQQISDFSTVAWVIKNSVRVHWRKNRNDADRRNRKVISRCENKSTDDAETTLSGSAFQILIPATGKARLPKGDSLKDGTTRKLVVVDRSVRRPNTWTRRMSK